MKKIFKVLLLIIVILIGIVLFDTLQASLFKNSPFISWKENLEDDDSWVDKGILIDTYYCTKEKDLVTVSWKFKTSKFTCLIDNDDLYSIQEIITNKVATNKEYTNFAACGIDAKNKVVIVELIDNSIEQQKWFRKNIIDSKYIKFIQGGPYTTSDNCNSNGLKIITGEIKEINNLNYKLENSKGTILINIISGLDSEDDIVFYHNSNIEFKIGQKVKVGYNGNIDLSNPPQAFAGCIELLQ